MATWLPQQLLVRLALLMVAAPAAGTVSTKVALVPGVFADPDAARSGFLATQDAAVESFAVGGESLPKTVARIRRVAAATPPQAPASALPLESGYRTDDESRSAIHAAGTTKRQRYLSSFAYTTDSSSPTYGMWTADDFITVDADGKERPWQNLILVTGNDTLFAQLSADVLRRTGHNLPILWSWQGGWRTDTQCWMVGRTSHCSQGGWPCAGGNFSCSACLRHCSGSPNASLARFGERYNVLRAQFPHLPPKPWGVYFGDEQDLARHPDRQTMLAKGLQLVKQQYPEAITYINMLYNSVGCPGPNPGGPFLCNESTWKGDPTALAVALGKMQLDWMSTDQYLLQGISLAICTILR